MYRTESPKPVAARRVEIERLCEAAERGLHDAANPDLGADSRFGLACQSILHCATAAMLAGGQRLTASEPGFHQVLIQSLARTAGVERRRILVLEAFRVARTRIDYFGEPVSDAVAAECVEEARALLAQVRARIDEVCPEA